MLESEAQVVLKVSLTTERMDEREISLGRHERLFWGVSLLSVLEASALHILENSCKRELVRTAPHFMREEGKLVLPWLSRHG